MNVYQFTHSDLDGVGCAVLTNKAFGDPEHSFYVSYVSYHNINEKLALFMETHKDDKEKYTLLITDICPKEDTAAALDHFQNTTPTCKLRLIDHHKTSSWVNQYAWARHDTNQCGTLLYYDWLLEATLLTAKNTEMKEFAELVDIYDRWLLEDPRRSASEDMNRLLFFLGFDRFVPLFAYSPDAHKSPEYKTIMEHLGRNQASHVNKIVDAQCTGAFVREDRDGNKFCMTVAEKDVSQICHMALDRFKELDYAVCVNPVYNKVDLRSRQGPGAVDVSEIAKRCGGGGHAAAAGFEINARAVLELALKDLLWKE
jgi:oligoribonuclease NrnB/cAMP/cGMP phosphodiesterase (DHH superfamily)